MTVMVEGGGGTARVQDAVAASAVQLLASPALRPVAPRRKRHCSIILISLAVLSVVLLCLPVRRVSISATTTVTTSAAGAAGAGAGRAAGGGTAGGAREHKQQITATTAAAAAATIDKASAASTTIAGTGSNPPNSILRGSAAASTKDVIAAPRRHTNNTTTTKTTTAATKDVVAAAARRHTNNTTTNGSTTTTTTKDVMAAAAAHRHGHKNKTTATTTKKTKTKTKTKKSLLAHFIQASAVDDPFANYSGAIDITQGRHVSSPQAPPGESSSSPSCSCWNVSSACCDRFVHPNHKFGHALTHEIFDQWAKGILKAAEQAAAAQAKSQENVTEAVLQDADADAELLQQQAEQNLVDDMALKPKLYFSRDKDYREVFVIRNWYDAIISGYLYHKSGKECYVDAHGHEKDEENMSMYDFDKFMLLPGAPYPAVKGRNLCEYLATESETAGLRCYVEWVIRKYYVRAIRAFWTVQRYEDPEHRKTLFICFEDLNNPVTKKQTVERVLHWLYPGAADGPAAILTAAPEKISDDVYDGSHGTSHDAELRERLRGIIRDLDRQYFNDAIARNSALFGCGLN